MKILQFGKFYPPHWGGMETAIFDLTEGLNQIDGVQCDVLCANDSNKTEIEKQGNYTVTRTATWKKIKGTAISPMMIYCLFKYHKQYDIIQLHHPDPMATLALWIVRPKIPVVIYWQSDIIKQKISLIFFKFLQNWMLKIAKIIVTNSENYGKHSLHLKKFSSKIQAIPIGINPERYKVNQLFMQKLKEKYKSKKIVFALGRYTEYKGYPYLIEAMKYIGDEYLLIIAGIDTDNPIMRDFIAGNNQHGKIELKGTLPHDEVCAYFSICDIFVLNSISKNEAYGVVQIEAMLFGKPVISTDIMGSGVSWVNQHGDSGLVVPPKDSQALAKAIEKLGSDLCLKEQLGTGAKKRFEKLFKSEFMVKDFFKLYQKVLS